MHSIVRGNTYFPACHLFSFQYCWPPLPAGPTAPLNLTFPPGGILNDSITLTWLHSQHPNGVVRFYQVQSLFPGAEAPVLVNTTDNTTTIVLSNLSPGAQYYFSVRAFVVFFGPFSARLSVHTADGEAMCCTNSATG